jgi:hypothetical protein
VRSLEAEVLKNLRESKIKSEECSECYVIKGLEGDVVKGSECGVVEGSVLDQASMSCAVDSRVLYVACM